MSVLGVGIGVPFHRFRDSILAFLEEVFTALWYPVSGTSMIDMFGGDPLTLSVDPSPTTTFSDWFLPSRDELDAMHDNLHAQGVGGFAGGVSYYWCSTENDSTSAFQINFIHGGLSFAFKSQANYVRPIRTFTAAAGQYSLRDVGPGGGLIFYIDGTTYYEAAPSDLVGTYAWSNIIDVEIGITAQGTAIGTGAANTAAIVAQDGHTASAAQECLDYSVVVGSGSIDYIPATYAGTITAPDVAGLKTADTDSILFDVGGTPQALSVSDLINTDLERIPVKYDNLAPHHIRMIGLFDPAVYATLTDADKRKISNYMDLWVFFWGGWLDAGSVNKENRTI